VTTVGQYSNEGGEMHVHRSYILDIESKSMEDCQELVRKIRAGTILPVQNWEASQTRMGTWRERIASWFRWNHTETPWEWSDK
jgi:hypothetical protein